VSHEGSQERTLIGILGRLRPHWSSDAALPSRIDSLLSGDRRLGSRDRRLYRELIYTTLRYLPWIEPLLDKYPKEAARRIAWLAADIPAVRPFRSVVAAGLPECPWGASEKALILGCDDALLTPEWLRTECPDAFKAPLRDTLLARAPLWLRLQTEDEEAVSSELDALGLLWKKSIEVPGALELPPGSDIAKTDAFKSGKVEIQDIGSQLVLLSVEFPKRGHWLDACAGAGGKTLQLASLLGSEGRVSARDVRKSALQELSLRAERAGLGRRISISDESDPDSGFNGVLVDAPCSGSGTWRRSPHLRWTTNEKSVRAASELQLRLLLENAPRVRQAGILVYATCSLCKTENEDVVHEFLGRTPGFEPILAGKTLLPQEHNGDGFFVASFRRAA
jgi:16S rRNA (cytosine967-C5)-methyltransferase